MNIQTIPLSVHCKTYLRLLEQLHELIASGKGDEAEADAVRDEMDTPWKHLTEDEIEIVRAYSAELHKKSEALAHH